MPGRPHQPDHGMSSGDQQDRDNGRPGIGSLLTAPDDMIRVKVRIATLRDGPRRSAGGPPQGAGSRATPLRGQPLRERE